MYKSLEPGECQEKATCILKAHIAIATSLRNSGVVVTESLVRIVAYLLFQAKRVDRLNEKSFEELLDDQSIIEETVRCYLLKNMGETAWESIKNIAVEWEPDLLRSMVLDVNSSNAVISNTDCEMATPSSIISLVEKIHPIVRGTNVADIGCGTGTYLTSAFLNQPNASYYGYEINSDSKVVASIRATLLGHNVHIDQCDAFCLVNDQSIALLPPSKFDFIFSNYPFAMKVGTVLQNAGVQKLLTLYPMLSKATSADWLFNALIMELLAPEGEAICVTTNGSTWNTTDKEIRKQFVEKGYVKAVIALPERLFSSTAIQTSLVILSHGNTSIRFVDATHLCDKGRRVNTLSSEHMDVICRALTENDDHSKEITIDQIRNADYDLYPGRYLGDTMSFENGVPFESIINRITRGAPYTASQLDEIISHAPTDYQYLMLANIQHGMIEPDLPYLTEIDPRYEKYCLRTGSLILSKNGIPYKVAVAKVAEGSHILANGNLYIIDLEESKANPYYVQAFLESEQGTALLSSITVGVTLPNIGVDKLKKLSIPLPPLEKQKQIAQAYLTVQDEVCILKRKLEKAQNRLSHVFDVESEE